MCLRPFEGEVIGPGINFPEIHLQPSAINVIVGTPTGTVANIKNWQDGTLLQIQEAAATPGQNVEVTFTGVKSFRRIGCAMYYSGSSTHWVLQQIYDFAHATWKTLITVENSNGLNYRYTDIPPSMADFIDVDGTVKLRFYHSAAGNAAHNSYIDYVTLVV